MNKSNFKAQVEYQKSVEQKIKEAQQVLALQIKKRKNYWIDHWANWNPKDYNPTSECNKIIHELLKQENLDYGIWFYGNYGVGKSWSLKYFLHIKFENGKKVAFISINQWKKTLEKAIECEKNGIPFYEHNLIEKAFKECDYFVLDDIGTEKPNEWFYTQLENLLDFRMNNHLITFFSSNCLIEQWKEQCLLKVLSPIAAGRLIERVKGLVANQHIEPQEIYITQNKSFRYRTDCIFIKRVARDFWKMHCKELNSLNGCFDAKTKMLIAAKLDIYAARDKKYLKGHISNKQKDLIYKEITKDMSGISESTIAKATAKLVAKGIIKHQPTYQITNERQNLSQKDREYYGGCNPRKWIYVLVEQVIEFYKLYQELFPKTVKHLEIHYKYCKASDFTNYSP